MNPDWFTTNFGANYTIRYVHRDDAEARQTAVMLKSWIRWHDATVLDIGCGAGRHLAAILECGAKRAVGVDYSQDLLRLAHQRLLTATSSWQGRWHLLQADMRQMPVASGTMDIATNFFTSFGYFAAEVDDRGVVAEVWRVLKPGGWWVLDFFNATLMRRNLVSETRDDVGGEEYRKLRRYDPTTRRIEKRVLNSAGHVVAEESVRAYTHDELTALLQAQGFIIVAALGGYDGQAFDESTSSRLIVLSQRPSRGATAG